MFEIKVISHAPGIAASGDGVVGWEGISLRVLPMPISSVCAPLANVGLVLRVIAIGLRPVGLDGILGIARLHAARAAEVPHGYGSHGDPVRVSGKHGARDTVVRDGQWNESCYGSKKRWEKHSWGDRQEKSRIRLGILQLLLAFLRNEMLILLIRGGSPSLYTQPHGDCIDLSRT